jgi:hypothetical protein
MHKSNQLRSYVHCATCAFSTAFPHASLCFRFASSSCASSLAYLMQLCTVLLSRSVIPVSEGISCNARISKDTVKAIYSPSFANLCWKRQVLTASPLSPESITYVSPFFNCFWVVPYLCVLYGLLGSRPGRCGFVMSQFGTKDLDCVRDLRVSGVVSSSSDKVCAVFQAGVGV